MKHIIYLTTNLVNGKKYIGRCSKMDRWEAGYLGSGTLLKKAVKKYGRTSFDREILEVVEGSLREAIDSECIWLAKMNVVEDSTFYNMSNNTGGFGVGDTHTLETKKKLSDAMKRYAVDGLPSTHRENVVNALKGRTPWNKGYRMTAIEKQELRTKRRKGVKLSASDIKDIRERYDSGESASRIATSYSASHHTILKVVRKIGKYNDM
ncbi:hypothetical protein HN588_11315 [Candidatus Bathyarchaeota archaeon]|jgi:group I intron endonuclease|nr:hypothetical protein [Candidatus Bathyarchaeota archaeon]